MDFFSSYDQGFARIGAFAPPITLGDPNANAEAILQAVHQAQADHLAVAVFPQLSLSGFSLGDLLGHETLLHSVQEAVEFLVAASAGLRPLLLVGAPISVGEHVLDCAVAIQNGRLLGVIPRRQATSQRTEATAPALAIPPALSALPDLVDFAGCGPVPLGPLVFAASDMPALRVFPVVGADYLGPSPAEIAAQATVVAHLDGTPALMENRGRQAGIYLANTAQTGSALVTACPGAGEASSDCAWDGFTAIFEDGEILATGPLFSAGGDCCADIDVLGLQLARRKIGGAGRAGAWGATGEDDENSRVWEVPFEVNPPMGDIGLRRRVARFPYLPAGATDAAFAYRDVLEIQTAALTQRLRAIGQPKLVLGVSGGIDSAHALLVAARTLRALDRPLTDLLAFTMPGFATSEKTRNLAVDLCAALGVDCEVLDIRPAAKEMLATMGHPAAAGEACFDITYENVQAGLRTDFLFRLANQRGGIVLGTGDLSELALGWCTYGVGDHMSHFALNAGAPKTLLQAVLGWVAATDEFGAAVSAVLREILSGEITPELIPTQADQAPQTTEASIGPYALQDFNLFHLIHKGLPPSRVAFLAWHAWADPSWGKWPEGYSAKKRVRYDLEEIAHWQRLFLRRFFSQQFKRAAVPHGPQVVVGGALSPRGGWQMPADASASAWLAELEDALDGVETH